MRNETGLAVLAKFSAEHAGSWLQPLQRTAPGAVHGARRLAAVRTAWSCER